MLACHKTACIKIKYEMKNSILFLMVNLLLVTTLGLSTALGQGVGINTGTPHPSSVLDVVSENRGVLIPRVAASTRLSIPSPATSLLVFDTDSVDFFFYNGSSWQPIGAPANTLAYTPDSIWIKENNTVYSNGYPVGIGTDSVLALFHLNSDTTTPYMLITSQFYNAIVGLDETDGTIFMGRDSSGTIKKQLVIDTAGRVGIGTATPDETLHLMADTGDAGIKMQTPLYNVIIGLDETDGTIFLQNDSSGVGKRRFMVDTAGRVGIGSIDPTAQLNVDGLVKTNEVELHSGGNSYVIALDDQGIPDLIKSSNNFIDLYGVAGDVKNFTNSFVSVPWSGERYALPAGSAYAHTTSTEEVTILLEGLYKVTYALSYEGAILFDAEIQTMLQRKPAAGAFANVPGSTTYSSVGLNLSSNRSTVSKTIILRATPGDVIKLLVQRSSGGGTITTLPDACSFMIERL